MATIRCFEDLEIWKMARVIAYDRYKLYKEEPIFSRDYELRNQINASTGSVMDNIAEGFERSSSREFINFLSIAKGSLGEVRSQLYRAFDREYLSQETLNSMQIQCKELSGKIAKFISYLNNSEIRGTKFKDRMP